MIGLIGRLHGFPERAEIRIDDDLRTPVQCLIVGSRIGGDRIILAFTR